MTDVNAASRSPAGLERDGNAEAALPGRRAWPWPMRLMAERLLAHVHTGRLTIVSPAGEALTSTAHRPGPDAVVMLHRWRALRRVLIGGDVALGEAYVDGDWSSPDVAALIALGALNDETLRETISGSRLARLLNRVRHVRRPNTRRGSSRNIVAHYDLGNAFYGRWLDSSMSYSSGLYRDDDETLEQAQERKLDRLVAALQLRGDEHVLEIGCGWGALAARLGQLGCRVTGVTISPAQLAYARDRIAAAGLDDRVELRLQDYRDVRGTFDRIVSVEMIEAVGQRYWPDYFAAVRDRLSSEGFAIIQAITIADHRFSFYAKTPDFIQLNVFPGGMLPSQFHLREQSFAANMQIEIVELFGFSYARTLREWRQRFAGTGVGEAEKTDRQFERLWNYYLAYCEGGFRSGTIDVGIYRLADRELFYKSEKL